MTYMQVMSNNEATSIIDRHYTMICPHCHTTSGMSAISIPRFELVHRYLPNRIGIGYRCDACGEPVFLRFVIKHDFGNSRFIVFDKPEEVEVSLQSFEYEFLPAVIAEGFREAILCFSYGAYNGFAALCRRTVQLISADLGAPGSDKVLSQIKELREVAQLDEETYDALKQIVVGGHDGAHPHLPKLSPERAAVLLELMKDIVYQLYVRKAKIQQAAELRSTAVSQMHK